MRRIRRDSQRFVDGAPDPVDVALDATQDDGGAHQPDAVDDGIPGADGLGRGREELSGSFHVAAHGTDLAQRFEIPGRGPAPVRLGNFGLAECDGFVPAAELEVAVDEVGDEERPEAAERADARLPVELLADQRGGLRVPAGQAQRVAQLAHGDPGPSVVGGKEQRMCRAEVGDAVVEQPVRRPAGAHAQQRAGFDADLAGASRGFDCRVGRADDLGIAAHPPQQHAARREESRPADPRRLVSHLCERVVDDSECAGLIAELREVPGEPVGSPRSGFAQGSVGSTRPGLDRRAGELHRASDAAGTRCGGRRTVVEGRQVGPRLRLGVGDAAP